MLLDRDAITNGQAATGGPFEFYDLGHGYRTYSFFEQCPHRMACARCGFCLPNASSESQLLEAKDGIQRILVEIPLTEDERAAVESDQHAVVRLIDLLADVATPAGPTPREIGALPPRAPPTRVRCQPPAVKAHDWRHDRQPRRTGMLVRGTCAVALSGNVAALDRGPECGPARPTHPARHPSASQLVACGPARDRLTRDGGQSRFGGRRIRGNRWQRWQRRGHEDHDRVADCVRVDAERFEDAHPDAPRSLPRKPLRVNSK